MSDRAQRFLAHLDERRRAALDPAEVERLLGEKWTASRAAWPTVTLDEDRFLQHLARHLPDDGAPLLRLKELRADELYLACACGTGDGEALRLFEEGPLADVRRALARLERSGVAVDDALQELRLKLFFGDQPRILDFAGRGELRGWLRVTATRAALKQKERERIGSTLDEDDLLADRSAPSGDAELDVIKSQHAGEFQRAFREALGRLVSRDQVLLRQYFLDGLTLEQLGALHKVNRSTVLRWIRRVQESVLSEVREALTAGLKLSTTECDSLLRIIHSQADVTFRRLLGGER
jgi:RNA polymerase sigma-70 factor (ECF subfamily)